LIHLQQHTDQQLLSLWISGDEKAFEEIYKRYFPVLVSVAWQKSGDRFIAEEVVQECMLAFYHRREAGIANVGAYLQVILRNKLYDYFRKTLIMQQHVASAGERVAQVDDPYQRLFQEELMAGIRKSINLLPEQCRKVFLLSREEHLSNQEIAVRLGISVNTVEQHMRKALRRLRQELPPAVVVFLLMAFYYVR